MILQESINCALGRSSPKVSVCVVTYNQEEYIEKCLQSLVDQVVPFEFEIIVGDDCSTDGTAEVVSRFASEYPLVVRPIIHSKNVGPYENYWSVHLAARGEYIAHIDGDDYTLPGKLATQVKFLDDNPDCILCGHGMQRLCNGVMSPPSKERYPVIDTLRAFLIYGNYLAHSSVMYRASKRLSPEMFNEAVDFQLHVARVTSGKVGYINECLGVYRVNSTGMVGGYYKSLKMFYRNVDAINQIRNFIHSNQLVDKALFNLCFVWVKNLIVAGNDHLAQEVYGLDVVSRFSFFQRAKLKAMVVFSPFLRQLIRIKRSS